MESTWTGYERILSAQVKGEGRINRPGHASVSLRRWKRLCGRTQWFQPQKRKPVDASMENPRKRQKVDKEKEEERKVESILYVPFTPFSTLRKQVQGFPLVCWRKLVPDHSSSYQPFRVLCFHQFWTTLG